MRYITKELDVLRNEKLGENDWNSIDKRMRWLDMDIFNNNNNLKLCLRNLGVVASSSQSLLLALSIKLIRNGPNLSKSCMDSLILKS